MEIDIKNYIENMVPELKGRLYPVFTTDLKDVSVTYKITPFSGGHIKQSQLEFRVIHSDYDTCKEIEQKILCVFDMEEDSPFVISGNTRFHSSIAGGGVIFNDDCQMFEDTLIFTIDWRTING